MNRNLLLIETSGRVGRVGLARSGVVIAEQALDAAKRRNADLASACRKLLSQVGLRPQDVGAVAVSVGPGSFTGLRVGLISAKVFAYALGIPLVAVPTFELIACRTPQAYEKIDVLADALKGMVFVQRFRRTDGVWHGEGEITIQKAASRDWTAVDAVTGPGVAIHEAVIPESVARVEMSLRDPDLSGLAVARLPISRETLFTLEPLYLRGSSAEEKIG